MENFIINNSQYIYPVLYIWSAIWKGMALWKAAKKDAKFWFVVIFIFNSFGLLEILYVFILYKVDFKKAFENLKSKIKK